MSEPPSATSVTKIVTQLIKSMGLEITAETTSDGELFLINLTGPDTRLLEMSRDNRAGAFITVIKLIAKQQLDHEPRLVLDFNHERQHRLENIALMAKKTAEIIRVRGGEEELRPMNPAERRAVHMALKEMVGIRTESRGVEPHRRIVIIQQEATD